MTVGRLIGIARRDARRAPMQEIAGGLISVDAGLEGDFKGARYPHRQITILECQSWRAALTEISAPSVPWTARRANLLVEGVVLSRAKGGLIRVGPVDLEVTAQTYPCARMEQAQSGLLAALAKDWRGGVTCRVLLGGRIRLGDPVELLVRPPEVRPRLPG